ncbi:putative reverse transcriptase domain-containing protein [Tanacetum coccineum]
MFDSYADLEDSTYDGIRKDWSYKLDNASWAFRTTFKTPLGTTLFRIIYGKACHLPINELDEMRLDAYESSISYKERTKRKLKSRWYGPFTVSKDMKNGAIELYDEEGSEFIVNKQQVIFDEKKLGSS